MFLRQLFTFQMKTLCSFDDYLGFIKNNKFCLVYFSTPTCNVCKVLKPKIINFINDEFPQIHLAYLNSEELKEVAAQNRIFTVPTILIFIEGKEYMRKSRNINLADLRNELARPYSFLFND